MSFITRLDAATSQPPAPQGLVHTLDQPRFTAACSNLMQLILQRYQPDLVVGIRTGGLVVAESMARSSATAIPVMPLTCRRAVTHVKARFKLLPHLLAMLPQPAVDRLRWLEHRLLSPRRRAQVKPQQIDHGEAAAIGRHVVQAGKPCRILVVDDAVDSGVTLATVLDLLRKLCPGHCEIRCAAITVTLANPLVEPDFMLYRGVLCRFPWSFDAAG